MRFSLPLNLNELGKLARFDVRIYGVAEQRREAWMGGACDLLPIPRAEPPHIQSTPDPPFPGHHGQETCRSGLVGLSTTLKLTGCQYNTNKNRFQLLV